jgi:hypothetical protein
VRVGGFTSLYAAVHEALRALDSAKQRRRAVLVISDGNDVLPGDRRFRSDLEIRNLSAEARLRVAVEFSTRSEGIVYAVGIEGNSRHEPPLNDRALHAITKPTGVHDSGSSRPRHPECRCARASMICG